MGLVKRFFRYKISTICFVVGMFVSFLALYYGNRSVYEYQCSVNETSQTHFRYEQKASFFGESMPVDELPKSDIGNCILHGLYLTIDQPNITTGMWISVYCNETYAFPLLQGHYPTMEEIYGDVPIAVVGSDYEDAIYSVDGKEYIDIQDESYLVTGILGGRSREYDDRVLLFGDNLGKNAKKLLETDCSLWGLDFLFQSDVADVSPAYETIGDYLEEYGGLYKQPNEYTIYQEVNVEMNITFYMILLYSAGVTALISVFWMSERKKEIIIRRRYGYGSGKILAMLFKDVFFMSLMAAIVSIGVFIYINSQTFGFMRDIIDEICLFGITFLTYWVYVVVVTLAYPVCIVLKKIPNVKK